MVTVPNSARLAYRLFNLDDVHTASQDLDDIWQVDQDPEVMKYLTNGVTTSKEVLKNVYIPRLKSYTDIDKGFGMWRISLADCDTFIGELIMRPMHFGSDNPHQHDIELGWRFIRKYWGQGYATEAADHLMRWKAQDPIVKRFSAIADTNNKASTAIMKKLGMRFITHEIHQDPLGDVEVDRYSLDVADLNTDKTNQ
ncbi:GNAT family N-acetyltransferase [Glaciecola sp. 1036]|uniref:GNAT family N-acetyltransferase n=1 Tax=Alteromonadaceae TaxID=72275 RepID=UPI003CFEB7EB